MEDDIFFGFQVEVIGKQMIEKSTWRANRCNNSVALANGKAQSPEHHMDTLVANKPLQSRRDLMQGCFPGDGLKKVTSFRPAAPE